MRKKYNTPHRSRVVKTRLTEDEYADFTARLAPYGISQSEFLRQAIRRTTLRPVLHVSSVNDELLSAVGTLAAEYGTFCVLKAQPVYRYRQYRCYPVQFPYFRQQPRDFSSAFVHREQE